MNKIEEALIKKYKDHRILFWYDPKKEFSAEYEALDLPEVQKIHVDGNEFQIKFKVTKQEPEQQFLLYFTNPKPANEENWLLDLELAYDLFHTDQEALFLQELGLGYHLKELVAQHIEFFRSKERRAKLKELLGEGDEHEELRGKMLSVTFHTDYVNLNTCIQAHATGFIEGNEKFDKDLERFNLSEYYWRKIADQYHYQSDTPTIYDFMVEVFNGNFALGSQSSLKKESRLLLLQWKDTVPYRDGFDKVSKRIAEDLQVEEKLQAANLDDIVKDDLFQLTEKRIIHGLVKLLAEDTFSLPAVQKYVKVRENGFWNALYSPYYACIEIGGELLDTVEKKATILYKDFEAGIRDYATETYRIDALYRKFIFHFRKTGQNRILNELAVKIEKVYTNQWLLPYSNQWDQVLGETNTWPTKSSWSQRRFFKAHVAPFLEEKQRLFVIISDALRYECGAELNDRLQAENRYESEIEPMVSSLPSYTQLGMASLLPHTEITVQEGSDAVLVDGTASSGVDNRSKILQANYGVRACAIQAERFMGMNVKTEGRDFVKQYDLIYIYHNRIDKVGDDKTTEEKLCEAVADELDYLVEILKKISNMNGNNMFITADHGFLYQYSPLNESDFISQIDPRGTVWKENRRFVLGIDLEASSNTRKYSGDQLGLPTEMDVLLPKSINRLRIKGAGSRYVHGGSSLQEIVIPLLKVSKRRSDNTSQVDIDIIKTTDRITTNILAVSFIQSDLVGEGRLPRSVRASIMAEDGETLSDVFKYNFDIEEGSERQREVKHRFQLLGKANGKYKNQRVILVLEEPLEGTTKWKRYKEFFYTLNISFTNDFDDF